MPRYKNKRQLKNNIEFYDFLRQQRNDIPSIIHYETIRLRNPSVSDRVAIKTTNHVWKYGDRYYNLAKNYYGNPKYWWVIAWWNARPTEAHVSPGDLIVIPLNIENTLEVLGAF
jgi:nucleoid-associated protein YgaU